MVNFTIHTSFITIPSFIFCGFFYGISHHDKCEEAQISTGLDFHPETPRQKAHPETPRQKVQCHCEKAAACMFFNWFSMFCS
jgi:hypothetical protein